MNNKEQQAKEYVESVPFYQDRKQHAAEDFIAGWDAALRELSFMTTEDFPASSMNENNCRQQYGANERTVLQENATGGNHQCEGLSSTGEDFPRTKETSGLQSHCSVPCNIPALLKGYPKIVEISDEELKRITPDSLPEGHLDNPGEKGHNGAELIADIGSKFGTNCSDYTWKQVRKRIPQTISDQITHRS